MSLAEKLSELAEKVEVLEEEKWNFDELASEIGWLRQENGYLRELLEQFGISPDDGLSVADVMAIEKALEMAKV